MTVTESIQWVLENAATLLSTFGEGKIFAPDARQDIDRPYIVHFPVACEPDRVHNRAPHKVQWTYQVSIFAETVAAGENAALLVIAALDGTHQIGSPVTDTITCHWLGGSFYLGREDEHGVEHFALEFKVSKSL